MLQNLKPKTYNLQPSRGFTLLEVVIAVSILATGIGGALALIISTTQLIGQSEDRLIAAHLAQEGIEVVRALRDSNWIQGSAFDAGFNPSVGGDYCVQYDSTSFISPCADETIYWNGNFYSHDASGTATKFERKINIAFLPNPENAAENIIQAQSIVSWPSGQIVVEERLYDWR